MGPLLQDPKRSSIRIVLNPERMVINESQRLYTYLSLFGFPVDAVIANRVLPEEARSKYFDRWFEIQAGHLATARQAFDPLPFFEARLFDREMVGHRSCSTSSASDVFGETDPTAVLLPGASRIEVKKEGERLRPLHPAALRGEGQDPGLDPGRRARRPGGQSAPPPDAAAHPGVAAPAGRGLRRSSGCGWSSAKKEDREPRDEPRRARRPAA